MVKKNVKTEPELARDSCSPLPSVVYDSGKAKERNSIAVNTENNGQIKTIVTAYS